MSQAAYSQEELTLRREFQLALQRSLAGDDIYRGDFHRAMTVFCDAWRLAREHEALRTKTTAPRECAHVLGETSTLTLLSMMGQSERKYRCEVCGLQCVFIDGGWNI